MEINDRDVEYVDRQSLPLDLEILLRTIPAVLKRDGAF
jgi:lipopolysaccharide/colanic/teichoic acid biosynthesis glycosyltransferase